MRFLILITLIFQIACSGELDPVEVTEVKSFNKESLTYTFEPQLEPNKYKVTFRWPIHTEGFEMISPVSRSFKATVMDVGFSEHLTGGREYRYQFLDKNGQHLTELVVTPPVDIVLAGKIEYSGDTLIRGARVFIAKDAVITSLRSNIIIRAAELISEGGTIQNYPTGFMECIRPGQGYDGGNITINAERARGELSVINQGAQGCHPGAKGGKGGEVKVNIASGEAFNPKVSLLRASGGPWVPTGYRALEDFGDIGTSCVSLNKEDGHECN